MLGDPALSPEMEPLLSSGSGSTESIDNNMNSNSGHDKRQDHDLIHPRSWWSSISIPLEVILPIYFIPVIMAYPTIQFYVYNKIAKNNGIDNYIQDQKTSDCTSKNQSDTIVLIQQEASQQFMYLSFASLFPSVLPVLFLGSIADKFGRKVSLLISMNGTLLKQLFCSCIFYFDLRIQWLYLANIIEGFSGSFTAILMSAFAMISDITEPNKTRSVRISIVEGSTAVAISIGLLIAGVWIQESGFLTPMVASTGLCLLSVILVLAFIRETKPHQENQPTQKILSLKNITRCFTFYCQETLDKRRKKLAILLLLFVLCCAFFMGKSNISNLYLLGKPFCWTALHLSVFNSVQTGLNWTLSILILKFMLMHFIDAFVLLTGIVCAVVALAVFGFADNDGMIYGCKYRVTHVIYFQHLCQVVTVCSPKRFLHWDSYNCLGYS